MQRPDIIFIVLDTQRADRLGCYGYRAPENGATISPNLDRIAERGVVFEQAISPAQWTIPSHASMFTGLYPTAHQVTQSYQSLGPDHRHLAEVLQEVGYQTVGFCNNPLVGILNNGFKRGFDTFYNYGGAIPSMPQHSTRLPRPAGRLLEGYTQFLRRISYPIQNFFARSDVAFRISINAWLTPLWSKMANFKGQNARSARDVTRFLRSYEAASAERPLFLFLNLMETHLPFWPPSEFVDQVAPDIRKSRAARAIMRRWNREAYRWNAPLARPLEELESRVLSDHYDAEVSYQDHYLRQLIDALLERRNAENTLTIIVSDHGDGLGEHGFFGHAFVAYQELVQVPLILHWPRQIAAAQRSASTVSTRRVYHTILDAAGVVPEHKTGQKPTEVQKLTLLETIRGRDPEQEMAFAEAYPPSNFAKAVQYRHPELLESCRCMSMRRSVVRRGLKLIRVSDQADELFDLENDPLEQFNIIDQRPGEAADLNRELEELIWHTESQRDSLAAGASLNLQDDEHLLQRLRGLGYIE